MAARASVKFFSFRRVSGELVAFKGRQKLFFPRTIVID